jgi:dTDP-4-dehydrorhamnose reductase
MKKILISGGNGNLAKELVKANTLFNIISLSKKDLDITNLELLKQTIRKSKPDIFIHTAALTRPMIKHIESPEESITTNIIGTSNVVLTCMKYNIKLIYISTDYVYPCTKGNYTESDPLLPVNEYAWSKLGGECAVKLYNNSLILRMALCQYPFPHDKALIDVKKSYLYMHDAADIIFKLVNETGVFNVGGKAISPYEFAKPENPLVGKIKMQEVNNVKMGRDASMNVSKMKKLLNGSSL